MTLTDNLTCAADHEEALLSHMVHILKVSGTLAQPLVLAQRSSMTTTITKGVLPFQAILPGGVTYAEVGGASAVSKVCTIERGGASGHCDVWLLLWEDGISVHPINRQKQKPLKMDLSMLTGYGNGPLFSST